MIIDLALHFLMLLHMSCGYHLLLPIHLIIPSFVHLASPHAAHCKWV